MQDRELVAAIAAGDPEGLAEAYDRYAASLYTYCRFMLPGPDPLGSAANAVQDTFIIAAAKLGGLHDPERLRSWLHAVARNECLRRLSGQQGQEATDPQGAQGLHGMNGIHRVNGTDTGPVWPTDPSGMAPAVILPDALREQVLKACADDTPAGRAYRVSVTHRAGSFGRSGFPKPITPSGPRWWRQVRRHPRAVAVAAAAGLVVLAGVVATVTAVGPHADHPAAFALGAGPAPSQGTGGAAGARSSPSRKAAAATNTPSAGGGSSPGTLPATLGPTKLASSPAGTKPSPSPSRSSSPSPSPSPTPISLTALPTKLVLTAVKGKAASGALILAAVGGTVKYTIKIPAAVAGEVTVTPSAGTLSSAGASVPVSVTVKSAVSLDTHLTVDPGGLIITIVLTIKA
jgi:DNA-directed RNA polymerase specialized sigma24 family protein